MPTKNHKAPSEQELDHCNALRQLVPECANFTESTLLRWLRSKDGKFDETAEGMKKNIVFRKAWGLDRIGKWTAPEVGGIL